MRRRNESGLTMVELVVILAIIAILAAAVYPSISNLREVMGAKGAAEEVAGALRLARQYAITRGNIHCVRFAGNPTMFAVMQAVNNNPANCTTMVQSPRPIGHGQLAFNPNPPMASLFFVFNPVGTALNVAPGPQELDIGMNAASCPRNTVRVTRFGGVQVFPSTGC